MPPRCQVKIKKTAALTNKVDFATMSRSRSRTPSVTDIIQSSHVELDDAVPRIHVDSAEMPPLHSDNSEERGRLKRRRLSSHSPPRATSPSRGHDRESGSRHRHHYRKHRKQSSSASISPMPSRAPETRRRSDAEPDHTLRGRARNRSNSGTRSPLLEEDEQEVESSHRKRSPPPSRHQSGSSTRARRRRSLPNLYKEESSGRAKWLQT